MKKFLGGVLTGIVIMMVFSQFDKWGRDNIKTLCLQRGETLCDVRGELVLLEPLQVPYQ